VGNVAEVVAGFEGTGGLHLRKHELQRLVLPEELGQRAIPVAIAVGSRHLDLG